MRRVDVAERPDWRRTAEAHGFHFHTIGGEPYWDERGYYAFSLEQIERDIEAPSLALHEMALALVDEVVASEALLARLAIPRPYWDWIADSWRAREPHLYGRLDLAFDGSGPAKLLELNYDTPTSLYEAAFFQWLWLEQQIEAGVLPAGCDQFNRIQEALVETFAAMAPGLPQPLYFSGVHASAEDQGTLDYLCDCALQAGLDTARIAIEDVGLSDDGRFTDLGHLVIPALFKLYPLEDLFGEPFGKALPRSGVRLLEPPWKAILSNKGVLPLLWERHRGHPNLLEARFAEQHEVPAGWVRKPFFSREGANVSMHLPDGALVESPGPDAHGPAILQAYVPLPVFAGSHAVLGSWMVGNEAAGLGVREDVSPITRDSARFVPHAIVP